MLSWTKVRWNHFFDKVNARPAKISTRGKASNTSQRLAQQGPQKETKTKEQMVPERYHEFLNVFDEKEANRFPSSKVWDHAIELKEDFVPKDCKIYPLSPLERSSLDKWINKQTAKGYITGLSILLCGKKGRQTETGTRLPVLELANGQKHIPDPSNLRNHRQIAQCPLLQQSQRSMGLQQHLHQGRGPMESSIQDTTRIIRANSNVLWALQLPRDISKHDELALQRSY
jgi:hypothetical protein